MAEALGTGDPGLQEGQAGLKTACGTAARGLPGPGRAPTQTLEVEAMTLFFLN